MELRKPIETDVLRRRRWQLSDGEDLENALHAAERLLTEADDRHRHEQNRTITIVSLIVGVVLSLAASIFAIRSFYFPALLPTAIFILLLVFLLQALLKQRRRMASDYTLRLAVQLSALIGETYLDVADREQWSYLRRESTKLRLSAFPLYDEDRTRIQRR